MWFNRKARIEKLKNELRHEIRIEMLPELIAEAKILAMKEIQAEEAQRIANGFKISSVDIKTKDVHKIARLIINKATTYKHIQDIIKKSKDEETIRIKEKEIKDCEDSLANLLDNHVSKSLNLISELNEENKKFIEEFDNIKLSKSKNKVIVYKHFLYTNPREYTVLNSLDYLYRPYISLEKYKDKVRIIWGVNYLAKIVKSDKSLSETFPIRVLEKELTEEDLKQLDGSIQYLTRNSVKVDFLGLVLTVTFDNNIIDTASLYVPGGIDRLVHGKL